jgi:predicted ATPase/DNA-binding CsgD family transcriptional regulator
MLGEYRLITLTGAGGAGKTRLAGEVAAHVADGFADGAWFADLTAVRDPALVAVAVSAALGVPEQPGEPAADTLARALARQQLLLVLDNCEHVIAAAARLCVALVTTADDLRILATSREPLGVPGEARYRLGSLGLDDAAVALFADRARRADARFAVTDENRAAVTGLVRRLDGLPLAIELAAARVEALGLAQLLDEIGPKLELLVTSDRLAAERHRSLAAAVEWSYRLLDNREQRTFRWLSMFPGPFTLEGAIAVAGTDAGPTVLRLVDSSLLAPPRAHPDGRSRYVMLETLRAYGVSLLTRAGEYDEAGAALAGYAVRLAERAAADLETGGRTEGAAVSWLEAEAATIDLALSWAVTHDADSAQRLALALRWWWYVRGRLSGRAGLLRSVADLADEGSPRWCELQNWVGIATSDPVVALEQHTKVRAAVAAGPPSRALVDCLCWRAHVLLGLGRVPEAAREGDRAFALARELDYPTGTAMALTVLSLAALDSAEPDDAVRLARQAEHVVAQGSPAGQAGIPGPITRRVVVSLAEVLADAGDVRAAELACGAALAGAREAGDLRGVASLLGEVAMLDLRAGRVADAAAQLHERFDIVLRIGGLAFWAFDPCGYLCAATGRWGDAVTIWTAFATQQRKYGYADAPADASRREELWRRARAELGPARAQAAEERGAAMSQAAAADYALMLTAAGATEQAAGLAAGPVADPARLSPRERELLTLVAQGSTDAEIAARLFISVHTVSSHLDNIRDKTGCRRRADLTRYALSAGLV